MVTLKSSNGTPMEIQRSTFSNFDYLHRCVVSLQGNDFFKNISAFAAAEAANKITRILAMVFVARTLSAEAFGIAALALTSFELIRIVTNNGIGQMIVRAEQENLEAVCRRAHQLNFLLCTLAGVLQCAVGFLLCQLTGTSAVFLMGACLMLVFLGMPFGLVRIFRVMRDNRMDVVARINFLQVSADNILALVLAISGFGAWALVLPKLLTFPIWLFGARRANHWKPDHRVASAPLREFVTFWLPVLATETLKGLRLHLDKAIIAALLGVEALGIYFFAFNAGLGLAQTLSVAFASCLYPQLCKVQRQGKDLISSWERNSLILLGFASIVFFIQVVASPFYVPVIFGDNWTSSVPVIAILCMAAAPRFFGDCGAQLARASKLTNLETKMTLISSAVTMTAIALGASIGGLLGAACGLTLAAWIVDPFTVFFIRKRAINERP